MNLFIDTKSYYYKSNEDLKVVVQSLTCIPELDHKSKKFTFNSNSETSTGFSPSVMKRIWFPDQPHCMKRTKECIFCSKALLVENRSLTCKQKKCDNCECVCCPLQLQEKKINSEHLNDIIRKIKQYICRKCTQKYKNKSQIDIINIVEKGSIQKLKLGN